MDVIFSRKMKTVKWLVASLDVLGFPILGHEKSKKADLFLIGLLRGWGPRGGGSLIFPNVS